MLLNDSYVIQSFDHITVFLNDSASFCAWINDR